MGNNRITGLADGIAATDAASVTQVTSAVAITGGTINGTTIGTTTRSSVKATTLDLGLSTQSVAIGQGDSSSIKNRIINGAMVIDQRNAGASAAFVTSFTLDRWQGVEDTDGAMTAQQVTDAPAGFTNSLKVTTTTDDASLGATQYADINQPIEGYNVADLAWGTADAKTITISFWVKSSLTGTFGGCLTNSAFNRSYPFTYTISSANTWEQKSITIAGDTGGTWQTTTSTGIRVIFGLGVGSTYSGTAGSWTANNFLSATGAVSVIGTLNATWQITGVQLEVGSQATGFEYRQYTTELQLCQRYFQRDFQGTWGATYSATEALFTFVHAVSMRALPTLSQASGVNISIDIIGSAQNATSQSISGGGASLTRTPVSIDGLTGRSTYQPVAIANTGAQLSAEL
jgi:hypothetical protein